MGVIQSATIICEDSELSNLSAIGFGGVTPYSIYWNSGDTIFNPKLGIGEYSYTFSDANNCLYYGLVEVIPPSISDVYEISSIFSRKPIELSIYDKLGSLIFFSNEELKWDGTYKNRKCQAGKYYYVLKYANQYTTGELLLLE